MPKWEYKTFRTNNLPVVGNGHEELEILNKLGQEGWECYWIESINPLTINLLIFSSNKIHRERIFYMKRPARINYSCLEAGKSEKITTISKIIQ